MDSHIERSAYYCLKAFTLLLQALKENQDITVRELSLLAVEDQLGRFKVWSGNLGALRRGHSSLDYRLRDEAFVAQNVVRLLQSLADYLLQGLFSSKNPTVH
jgi:hypothetical protein